MLGLFKYTLLFLVFLTLSACVSTKDASKPQQVKVVQVSEYFQMSFPTSYNGLGFHATEDGEGFKLNRADDAVRFFFESNSRGNEKLFQYTSDSLIFSMKGFKKQINLGQQVVFFYNEQNGLKDLNSNAAICFKFDKKLKVVVYVAYRSSEQKEVERIASTLVERTL